MQTEIRFAIGRTTSTDCPSRALVDAARAVQALRRGLGRKVLLREAEDRLSGAGRRNSNRLHTDYRCGASRVYTYSRGRTTAESGGAGAGARPRWAAAAVGSTGANGGASAPGPGGTPIPPIKAMYCLPSRR